MNMCILFLNKYSNLVAIMVIVAVLVSIFGALYFMGMGIESNGKMSDYIFMGMDMSICTMSLSEHINLWKEMFSVILQKGFFLNTLLIILLCAVSDFIVFGQYNKILFLKEFFDQFYLKQKTYLSFFNYLKESLSSGTLNPKIYQFAAI